MVDALGVSGYEGTFRRSCEITLEFLRSHENMVMTMLETFLHDPINDWKKKKTVSISYYYSDDDDDFCAERPFEKTSKYFNKKPDGNGSNVKNVQGAHTIQKTSAKVPFHPVLWVTKLRLSY